MPPKHKVLSCLKRDELIAALDAAGLEVADRRKRDLLQGEVPNRLITTSCRAMVRLIARSCPPCRISPIIGPTTESKFPMKRFVSENGSFEDSSLQPTPSASFPFTVLSATYFEAVATSSEPMPFVLSGRGTAGFCAPNIAREIERMRPRLTSVSRRGLVALGLCLLLAPCIGAVPQRLRFETLSIEQGLPQQSVLSVLQDRHGFMWFATQGGAARFDGYQTSVFRHDREDPGSISANRIWKIFEDRAGDLWLGTAEGGLNRFHAERESFRAYRHDAADPSTIPNDRVWDIYQDRHDRMWIATSGGLALFDPVTEVFTLQAAPGLGGGIRAILEADTGDLWIATSRQGLVRFDPETGTVDAFRSDPSDPGSLPNNQVLALLRDETGALWVGTAGGLALFDEASRSFRAFRHDPADSSSLASDQVNAIFEDRAGHLWIGTDNGLSLLDRDTGRCKSFMHDPHQLGALSNQSIAAIFQDRTGILWFGTWYGGVARADLEALQLISYLEGTDPRRSPPGGVIALHEDLEGTIWVGTSEGLAHFDAPSGEFSRPEASGDPTRDVTGIAQSSGGHVWVGFRPGELELWSATKTRLRTLDLNENPVRRTYINSLCLDPSGTLWVAHQGLMKLEPDGSRTHFTHRPGDPTSLKPSGIKTLTCGKDGAIWVGFSDRGLARLAAGADVFEHVSLYPETEGQPSVSSIYEDEGKRIWVGTNAGLFRIMIERQQPDIRFFTIRQGLSSDLIAAILPDSEGRLWLSTVAGISCFDPEKEIFRNYGVADGALPGGYNKGAAIHTKDGRMVFGGPGGMTLLRPRKIRRDPTSPLLVLTDLRLSNRSVPVTPGQPGLLDRPIHLTEEVLLGPHDDPVSFEFAALHFAAPLANRYAYKLEGVDKDWISAGADQRRATYTDLPSGTHLFRVKGSNQHGIWNEQGIRLTVEVSPSWWRSWWAYTLYVIGLGGLILGLLFTNRRLETMVTERTAKVRDQARRIQHESDAKARFIANVSHELRTPLTLAIGPLEDLRRDRESQLSAEGKQNLGMALRNAHRMVGLVGEVLDIGRLEAGQMRLQPTETDFVAFVRSETKVFAAEAQRRGVIFETMLPEAPISLVFDPGAMSKVISNLLSNAVKFTLRGDSIRIRLQEAVDGVAFEISDTGRGISKESLPHVFERYFQGPHATVEQPGTGVGLALVKELVELHGGRVEARSQLTEGSAFTVILRRGRDHFQPEALQKMERSPVGPAFAQPQELSVNVPALKQEHEERPTILVVDDNDELRRFLTVRLSASFHILEAGDGQEALVAARRELPDLIVSDVTMPELDGFAMTRQLRLDPEISFLPVLLLTARAARQDTLDGFQAGADDYLTKPFDTAELVARVQGILASRRRMGDHLRWQSSEMDLSPRTFEEKVRQAILENLEDGTLKVQDLASALALDRTTLFRKVRQSFGMAPTELIRKLRLERAAELLRGGKGNVTEICYASGFPNLSYFGKRFRERYGMLPSHFGQAMNREAAPNAGPRDKPEM